MTVSYKTADLRKDLDGHEKRLKWLEEGGEILSDHIQRHEEIYDKKLNKHEKILYGADGDDGLTFDVRQLMEMKKNIDKLTVAVVGEILVAIIALILK